MEKKRAAAYCRVSTNTVAQEHSFRFQEEYWKQRLVEDPEYEYVGMFADQGISGKFEDRRPQYMAMLEACRAGKIDVIFTKSVQRFARNKVELLKTVHELRDMGVAIIFEKENINTLNPDCELFLTIAAAIAEDDLTRYSQNVTWTIRDRCMRGEVIYSYRLYGYIVVNSRTLQINEEEAEVVRWIYETFAEGNVSSYKIRDMLNERNIPAAHGGKWGDEQVRNILRNEKYCGDSILQKHYMENGVKKINYGERSKYLVENSHEAIVSRELWQRVQEILEERGNEKLRGCAPKSYPFTGLIECGVCGGRFRHKKNNIGTMWEANFWKCGTAIEQGVKHCHNSGIKEELLHNLFVEAYNEFVQNEYKGLVEEQIANELKKLYEDERELIQLKARGWISKTDFEKESVKLRQQITSLEIQEYDLRMCGMNAADRKPIASFEEEKVHRFIKKVIVYNWTVTFEFYNGVCITKAYTNGQHGNIDDWCKKHGRRKR